MTKNPKTRKKRPRGRPPKYDKISFARKVDEYLDANYKNGEFKRILTVLDFCIFAGVDKHFIAEHTGGENSRLDFSASIKKLKTYTEYSLEYFTMAGKIPTAFAIFSLKNNYGWRDKQEVGFTDQDGKDRKIERVEVQIIPPNSPKNEN